MMARLKESRWVYILLSILLAIIFWFYVRAAVDPNGVTNIHNVRVEVTGANVLASQGLAISEISPQVVLRRQLCGATLRAGGEKELAHFLLHRHGGHQFVDGLLPGVGLRLGNLHGDKGGHVRRRRGGGRRALRRRSCGRTARQQQDRQGQGQKMFHVKHFSF